MNIDFPIFPTIFIGIAATVFMDGVGLVQRRMLGIPPLDYALVGRWLGHTPRGRLVHRPILRSAPVRGERALRWVAHYLIGIVLAGVMLALSPDGWLIRPGPVWPVALGAATVTAPFLVLQPGMGAGVFARKTPAPWTARSRSIAAHVAFGVGLWLGTLGWAAMAAMR